MPAFPSPVIRTRLAHVSPGTALTMLLALLLVIGSRIYIRRMRRIELQHERLEAAVEERTKELQAEKNRSTAVFSTALALIA